MVMEMFSSSFSDVFSLKFLMFAMHSLRYELTFAIVLVAFWSMGQLTGLRGKPTPSAKPKLSSHSPVRSKPPSPRTVAKGQATVATKSSPNKVSHPTSPPAPIERLGRIDQIDAAQLCDPSWLVPQATHMCRTQVHQALALYRAALQAGLNLNDMPENDCHQLFVALVTSAIRAGHMDDAMQLLRDLRKFGPGVHSSLFSSVTKLCTSKHAFAECLSVYDFMVEDKDFTVTDKSIWSCLLFSAIEVHTYDRCSFFFCRLRECGAASPKDYGNMIRLASLQTDWKSALKLIEDMQQDGLVADSIMFNTALGTCVSAQQIDKARVLLEQMEHTEGLADVITYNTLMKGYARAGCMDQALEIFHLLKQHDISPSHVTYGILLDGYINENQLERAAEIFSTMSAAGYAMNTVLYTTLIKGFARAGEVDEAMKVYAQMQKERSVSPDLITFSILIKANCDGDRLEEALKLLEAMVDLKLNPDEVVFNSLLAGCARSANAKLGKRLYLDMQACGIRPSNATFSILIRFFLQCKLLEDAVEMLRTEPAKHKVHPEPRVFLQLIQSCIRERQGRRAVEVYEMFAEQTVPSASCHASLMGTCVKLNMYDTAAEIMAIAASKGAHVDSQTANSILDGAIRKRKLQVAQEIAVSMKKMGLSVEPSHLTALARG